MCKERLSLVKIADSQFGSDSISVNHATVSSSHTTDVNLTTNDQTNPFTRKYYEVCFLRCEGLLNFSSKMPSLTIRRLVLLLLLLLIISSYCMQMTWL